MVQNFHEIAENPMNENFRDKNFVIATFFREYHRAAATMRTVHIHVVAPPIIARVYSVSGFNKRKVGNVCSLSENINLKAYRVFLATSSAGIQTSFQAVQTFTSVYVRTTDRAAISECSHTHNNTKFL